MRALLLLMWMAGVAAAAPVGFDHNVHARDVAVAAQEDVPCAKCHAGATGLTKPNHDACFGCHADKPAKVCETCHTDAKHVFYPPYDRGHDFALQLGHQQHAQSACGSCHTQGKAKASPFKPHERCAGCHDGKSKFAMTACKTCHSPGIGEPDPPKLAQPQLALNFSHDRHAKASCATCHAAVEDTNDTVLPRPSAATCAIPACHDGEARFGRTTDCTRCHSKTPAKWKVTRPGTRFSHTGSHQIAVQDRACAACHPLSASGEPLVTNHTVCVECHSNDFGDRDPKICNACHNGTEPWRKLVGDAPEAQETEIGAQLDHTLHDKTKCAACHSLTTSRVQLRPARGHVACGGSGCHTRAGKGGAAPALDSCDGCHQIGLASSRLKMREAAAWSVRARFDHAGAHAKGTECATCHTDLSAKKLLELATPAKSTCAPCHDGRSTFKLTGTSCKKCHGST